MRYQNETVFKNKNLLTKNNLVFTEKYLFKKIQFRYRLFFKNTNVVTSYSLSLKFIFFHSLQLL